MNACSTIISTAESMRIRANDLRRAALQSRATELNNATLVRRDEILAEIERQVKKELQHSMRKTFVSQVLY
jgi:hypothetical protein